MGSLQCSPYGTQSRKKDGVHYLGVVLFSANENKISRRWRGRAGRGEVGLESWKAWSYAGQWLGCIAWLGLRVAADVIADQKSVDTLRCRHFRSASNFATSFGSTRCTASLPSSSRRGGFSMFATCMMTAAALAGSPGCLPLKSR